MKRKARFVHLSTIELSTIKEEIAMYS